MSLGSDITISSQVRRFSREFQGNGWENITILTSLLAACSLISDEKLKLGCAVYIFNLLQNPNN